MAFPGKNLWSPKSHLVMNGHSRSRASEQGAKHDPRTDYPPNNNLLSVWNDNTITRSISQGEFSEKRFMPMCASFLIFLGFVSWWKMKSFFTTSGLGTLQPLLGQSICCMQQKMKELFGVMKNFATTVGLSEINFVANRVPIGCEGYQSPCRELNSGLKWWENVYI